MARKPALDHTGRKVPVASADGIIQAGFLTRDGGQLDKGLSADVLLPQVEVAIRNYRPRKAPWAELWPLIEAFVLRIVLLIRPPTVESARLSSFAVTRLAGWAVQRHLALDEEIIFHPLRVEEFIATVEGFTEGHRYELRTRLRAIGPMVTRDAPWPPPPPRQTRRLLSVPYTGTEIELLKHDIAQQSPILQRPSEVVHHLGLGAGLRPGTIRVVEAEDLVQVHGEWCVAVRQGAAVYYVPILRAHVPPLLELAERYSVGPMVHERADRKTIGSMLQYFKAGRSTPWPSAWRYRSTWLLTHLILGTRLDLIARAAGVRDPKSLVDLLKYLPALDPAEATRLIAGGGS